MKLNIKEKLNHLHGLMLVLIICLSVLLRIVAIDWGMPHDNLHPDEGLVFTQAYECALYHTFEVRTYYRPNHVLIKLNTLLYLGIQELYFAPQGMDDFVTNYSEHFALFTTSSRILIALFGVGTIILAYYIGLFWGRKEALYAALLFAVFPSFIEHSHYITPDVPLLFFLLGVLWAALHYHKNPSVSWLFWMSFFTALATCEKYPGAYGCLIIAVCVCVTQLKLKKPFMIIKHGALAILFFVLGIMAISPVLVVDYKTVLEIMAGQNKDHHLGADGLSPVGNFFYYLQTTGIHLGLILTLSSIYGMIKSIRRNVFPAIILLSLLAYIIPVSVLSLHWERYALPLYAVGLFFGAFGAFYLLEDLQKYLKGRHLLTLAAYGLFLLLPAGSLLTGAISMDAGFLAPDSRILLQDVFAGIDVTPYNTVYDCNTPMDPGGYYGAFSNFDNSDPAQFKYGSGPKFIMTSSAQRDLYLNSDPEVYGWIAEFYRRLDEEYPLVYHFPVEKPECHFLELQNIWSSARTVHRYMRGAANGYEIRLYQLLP